MFLKKSKLLAFLVCLVIITFNINLAHANQISASEEEKKNVQITLETFITEAWNINNDVTYKQRQTQNICKDDNIVNNIERNIEGIRKEVKSNVITDVRTKLKFNFYNISINQNIAKVKFDYFLSIYYKNLNVESTPTRMYNLHDIELEKINGTWVIISSKDYTNPDPNNQPGLPDRRPELPTDVLQDTNLLNEVQPSSTLVPTYNRTVAVNYAYTYYYNPNSAYRNMGTQGSGGDCTNFASQV